MNQSRVVRVVVVGLGPIGTACARAVLAEQGLELVGMVDRHPDRQGLSATELIGGVSDPTISQASEPRVIGDLERALADGGGADVAIVTTSSRLADVAPLVRQLLARGVAVVSSCEELVWPWYRHGELAESLDEAARQAGRAVLGTGVNPGFVMDTLAVTLASVLRRVSGVRCVRRVDAAVRRMSLHRKLGMGMTPEAFAQATAMGQLSYVGMAESVAMLAAGLGRCVEPGSVKEEIKPVLAERTTPSPMGLINPGEVLGVHWVASWQGGGVRVKLDLTMAVGLTDAMDRIVLEGPVQLSLNVPGALPGDSATVAMLLNQARRVCDAPPGLRTMLDMPPAGCTNRDRREDEELLIADF